MPSIFLLLQRVHDLPLHLKEQLWWHSINEIKI